MKKIYSVPTIKVRNVVLTPLMQVSTVQFGFGGSNDQDDVPKSAESKGFDFDQLNITDDDIFYFSE